MNQALLTSSFTTRTERAASGRSWKACLVGGIWMLLCSVNLPGSESLPLPSWGEGPSKQGALIGVFPANYTAPGGKGQASGGAARQGSKGLDHAGGSGPVLQNYQLFLPNQASVVPETPPSTLNKVEVSAAPLGAKTVVERVKLRKGDLPLIQFASDEPLPWEPAMRRFATFMQTRLQIPLCVFLLGEGQVLESSSSWIDLVDELRVSLHDKRLVVVVGGDGDFLRLLFLNAESTYLKPEDWAEVVEHSLANGQSNPSYAQKVEQVLTRFTAEALRRLETSGTYANSQDLPMVVAPPNVPTESERVLGVEEKSGAKDAPASLSGEHTLPPLTQRVQHWMQGSSVGLAIMLTMGVISGLGCLWSWRLRRRALRASQTISIDPMQWFGDGATKGEEVHDSGEESLMQSEKEEQERSK